jgi:DNA-binding transcriptional MerR regulator
MLAERQTAEMLIDEVEQLDAVDAAVQSGQTGRAHTLVRALRSRLAEKPVRVSVAAELIGVSQPTIRAWADEGVLETVDADGPRAVTLGSVLRVRPVVAELRALGRQRDLMSAVLAQVDDRELLDDKRLQSSLAQMRRGELVFARRRRS